MKYIKSGALMLSMVLVVAVPVNAVEQKDTAKTPEQRLEAAATHFRDWFESLLGHIDDIVAKEDRRRLAHELETLEGTLFRFEMEKREMIEALTSPNFNDGRAANAVDRLEASLTEVRRILTDKGLPLRKEWKDKGDQVEGELAAALGVRNGWIADLRNKLQGHEPFDRDAVAKAGAAALEQLRAANVALTKLISKLQK